MSYLGKASGPVSFGVTHGVLRSIVWVTIVHLESWMMAEQSQHYCKGLSIFWARTAASILL